MEKISKTDLRRAADIARTEHVTVELELDGRLFRFSPVIAVGSAAKMIAPKGGVAL